MVRSSVVECSFLVPVKRDCALVRRIVYIPRKLGSGSTIAVRAFWRPHLAPGLHEGFYQDPDTGEKVSDKSYKYTVALPRQQG